MSETIAIRRPDDWHVHLRDGAMLEAVAPHTARQFARAIIMPNLVPPVTTVAAASAYRERIISATGPDFTPLMTAYLTDDIAPEEIERGHREAVWVAAKLYPAGATTNSASGVTDIRNIGLAGAIQLLLACAFLIAAMHVLKLAMLALEGRLHLLAVLLAVA